MDEAELQFQLAFTHQLGRETGGTYESLSNSRLQLLNRRNPLALAQSHRIQTALLSWLSILCGAGGLASREDVGEGDGAFGARSGILAHHLAEILAAVDSSGTGDLCLPALQVGIVGLARLILGCRRSGLRSSGWAAAGAGRGVAGLGGWNGGFGWSAWTALGRVQGG